ncbi:MAG: hypothetical protein ACXIVQ_05010 [Acidimicrobiales bacterium]
MRRRKDSGPRIPDRDRPVGREADRSRTPEPSEPSNPVPPTPEPPAPELGDPTQGARLIRASWIGTGVFGVITLAGVVAVDEVAPWVVWLSFAMFVVGCVLFFVAYAIAVGRSRTDAIGIGGLYFLAGSAPREVRRSLMGSLAIQCAIVVAVVVVRPFTSLVLSALAPMYGLGCAGVWGARYGVFGPRARRGDDRPAP